ncbi:class I SAM-dependent methyltransferase [Andreprevotia sp. IGB-42]|uniref:class I SAM-dependent methyltransferase n=1 Tax=Andreprevotia sp. IGB-42 TaxID=2497473 RepID=UPI001F2E646C|nr:methyltransferase domain-containing protein [Andreprevotia sp. IGB-42]
MALPSEVGSPFDHFAAWLATPLGQYVAAEERNWYDRTVVDIFGYKAVQLELPQFDALRTNRMPWRATLGLAQGCRLRCDPAALPVAEQSLDLLVLPHVLDFSLDPHAVLREAERVLAPQGRLLVTGFNPWSLWGMRKLKRNGEMPWQGQFVAMPRLKDWLALLGLETVRGEYLCYRPPVQREGVLARSGFMETAGDRWWPAAGGIYCLDVVKRVRGMRVIEPQWKRVKVPTGSPAAAIDRMKAQAGKDKCK